MPKDFRFLTTKPAAGWTAASIVQPQPSATGPVNALAQNNVTAESLRTTPSTLADSSLGSRKYVNPNTGIRDVAVSGSVYAQPDVPAFLSQAVAGLNAEQALQRSMKAEWNDRLMRGVMGQYADGGADPYVWAEALRAASVGPGSSVSFGQQIADPHAAQAALINAHANASISAARAGILNSARSTAFDLSRPTTGYGSASGIAPSLTQSADANRARLNEQARFLSPIAQSAAGGWTSPNRFNYF